MVSGFGKSLIAAAALAIVMGSSAHAQDKLKVIVFPGLSNLAQFAAEAQGFYKKRNLAVEIIYTPNSDELRNGLARRQYDIAHGGVDNAVAQVENDKTDLFIFMGGNCGLNSLFVQPEIKSYEQLRGTTMAVDCAEHRVRAAALQDARREGHQAQRLQGRSRSARRICGSRRC